MKTIKQIIEEYNLSPNEAEGFERMISMMMVLRKHMRLKELYENQNGGIKMKPNLEKYLKDNFEKGIIDHVIRVSHIDQSGKPHFYIHPHGYDGDTLDFVVNENWITQKYTNE